MTLPEVFDQFDKEVDGKDFKNLGNRSQKLNLDAIFNQPNDYSSGPDSMFDVSSPINASTISNLQDKSFFGKSDKTQQVKNSDDQMLMKKKTFSDAPSFGLTDLDITS